jgi:hypothetical protein
MRYSGIDSCIMTYFDETGRAAFGQKFRSYYWEEAA